MPNARHTTNSTTNPLQWFALIICGQVMISLLLDHYGWLGMPLNRISPLKIAGTVMLVGGVLTIVYAKSQTLSNDVPDAVGEELAAESGEAAEPSDLGDPGKLTDTSLQQ
ncbi:MAG: DMT family transporter [Planctomycetota bacterium]